MNLKKKSSTTFAYFSFLKDDFGVCVIELFCHCIASVTACLFVCFFFFLFVLYCISVVVLSPSSFLSFFFLPLCLFFLPPSLLLPSSCVSCESSAEDNQLCLTLFLFVFFLFLFFFSCSFTTIHISFTCVCVCILLRPVFTVTFSFERSSASLLQTTS